MTFAQQCEKETAQIFGGKLTPGSGNKNIKGDVMCTDSGLRIEVKSTIKDYINIQHIWLTRMELLIPRMDVVLVIWFGDSSHCCYYPRKKDLQEKLGRFDDWSTKKVNKDMLYINIPTKDFVWELVDVYELAKEFSNCHE